MLCRSDLIHTYSLMFYIFDECNPRLSKTQKKKYEKKIVKALDNRVYK